MNAAACNYNHVFDICLENGRYISLVFAKIDPESVLDEIKREVSLSVLEQICGSMI